MMQYLRTLIIVVVALMLAVASSAQNETIVVDLVFVNHTQAGLTEQDVFLDNGDGTVRRAQVSEALSSLYEPLYATATFEPHDFFELGDNPVGPYEQGAELGFTLFEWMAATGTGTYTESGDTATIEASFAGLIPNGVYTLWCSRTTLAPEVMIVDEPCGAADGSQNDVIVDEFGNGSITLNLPALPKQTETELNFVTIAYHSDGESYGASPGEFGFNSHIQIFSQVSN